MNNDATTSAWDPGFAAGLDDELTSELDSPHDISAWEGEGGSDPSSYSL